MIFLKDTWTRVRNFILFIGYKCFLKPILFRIDPEKVHDFFLACGVLLGRWRVSRGVLSFLFNYQNAMLRQEVAGVMFPNPVGLAAGFDKNAQLISVLPAIGFGHVEVGSTTGLPCLGNPKPRLWRAPKSKSLLVYYGLKNDGARQVGNRVRETSSTIPVGVSIAKTNSPDIVALDAGIHDYHQAYCDVLTAGSYLTINISCPNAFGGQPFTDPKDFKKLIARLHGKKGFSKPVFIKFSPDIQNTTAYALAQIGLRYGITGVICSNLTKNRNNSAIKDAFPEVGGFSGKLVEPLANNMIRYLYKRFGSALIIIGCGGVFTADDAYQKIRSGATMVQLITGMIYNGPQTISSINCGLANRLRRDGFSHISEAIGVDA